MKYLKSFEGRYSRETKYQYLNLQDTARIRKFIETFINDKNLPNIIEKLNLEDFFDQNFVYKDLFDELLSKSYYNKGNMYYEVDLFCKDNNIHESAVKIRNSMFNIIEELYTKKYKDLLTPLFDNRIIEIIKINPQNYKEIYDDYEEDLSDKVKDGCEHILGVEKYNV